jgi:hypothetical protein
MMKNDILTACHLLPWHLGKIEIDLFWVYLTLCRTDIIFGGI